MGSLCGVKSPDGTRIASASNDKTVKDLADQKAASTDVLYQCLRSCLNTTGFGDDVIFNSTRERLYWADSPLKRSGDNIWCNRLHPGALDRAIHQGISDRQHNIVIDVCFRDISLFVVCVPLSLDWGQR